jgi:uncharacterized protein (TIGR03000 family)
MYSIVMLAAMSAGADTPTPMAPPPTAVVTPGTPVIGGCTGSCFGSHYSSCHGSCYGSCYGSCHGSGRASCHGGGFLGLRGRHSCHGGGHSCSGYTCFGSCHGSCHGSCYGSCFGSYAGSCYGCYGMSYGSTWGPPVGMLPYTLHGYNSGGAVIIGDLANPQAVYGKTYYPNQPPTMTIPVAPMAKPTSSDGQPNGANLRFNVPEDAKLYVDGKLTPGSGPERAFYTPSLESGREYYYEVYTERMVDGKLVATDKKKVIVEAGKTITVEFEELTGAKTEIVRK